MDTTIVRAAIHPGIGVARMGNSEHSYYIGPETIKPGPEEIRDPNGAIKRQAARFRIYGYNAAGEVVGELNNDNAEVEWSVHLANRKAQWYKFVIALDIPEWNAVPSSRRNPDIKGAAAREQLVIDPGPRTIMGQNISGAPYQFDTGTFLSGENKTVVPLGELRTDEFGRLLVLGGLGQSGSPTNSPIYDENDKAGFLNPDNWFDDASDGPVTAEVTIAGQSIPVESSWVVVAPPNYAPDIVSWRTLYDLLVDTYIECGWLDMPTTPSFTKDILPVLSRLSQLQWVNKGFAMMFGKGCPMDFSNPEFIAKLAFEPEGDNDTYHELRRVVFNIFRPTHTESNTRSSWPWIYGDAYGSAPDSSPRNNLALSAVRMALMKLWVEGTFVNDWDPTYQAPNCLDGVPVAEQPAMLDQAALHFCLADAFHPGCEVTWPMRHSSLYRAPFRVRHSSHPTQQDYGSVLTQELALQPGGPLYEQGPGDLTRWMGLPWQADTGFCRSGYHPDYDPYLPTFWPANVPNNILTEESYDTVINPRSSPEEKLAAFYTRESWVRGLPSDITKAMEYMVDHFGKLGVIEPRPGLENHPDIPAEIFVESLHPERVNILSQLSTALMALPMEERPSLPPDIQRAGWDSVEQFEAFRKLRGNG